MDKRVGELLREYKHLMIEDETSKEYKISGDIVVHRSIEQFVLNKSYKVLIIIPKEIGSIPYVYERGGIIDTDYLHINSDGRLCLSTDVDMQIAFCKEPSLVSWMKNFVEPFFVSYEFFKRYGFFPMGDRKHGATGIVQSYMDFFGVNMLQAEQIIIYLSYEKYRGHQPCPCGSGKRIRNCHGTKLLEFFNKPILANQVKVDCETIIREVDNAYSK